MRRGVRVVNEKRWENFDVNKLFIFIRILVGLVLFIYIYKFEGNLLVMWWVGVKWNGIWINIVKIYNEMY